MVTLAILVSLLGSVILKVLSKLNDSMTVCDRLKGKGVTIEKEEDQSKSDMNDPSIPPSVSPRNMYFSALSTRYEDLL